SWLMRFHTQTAGVSLTAQQPEVNLIRTAIEALAAVLGGTQSLHTNSFDEALALPTEHAVRLALRTQQVIAHETGVVNTIDPLGGSYYVEELTNRLEAEAYDYFDRIAKLGGVVAAIKDNFFQREIADASFRYQAEVALWMAFVLLIVIPTVASSSTEPTRAPFRQPVSPPGPHPGMPLKQ